MNLTEAFMERNDLKREAEELYGKIITHVYYELGVDRATDLDDWMQNYYNIQAKLTELNIAIYKANNETIKTLKEIERIDSVIKMLEAVKASIPSKLKVRNNYRTLEDAPAFIQYELNISGEAIEAELKIQRNNKRALEKELARLNGKTELVFG